MPRPLPSALLAALALVGAAVLVLISLDASSPSIVERVMHGATDPAGDVIHQEDPAPFDSGEPARLVPAQVASERVEVASDATAQLAVRVKLARRPVVGAIVRLVDGREPADRPAGGSTDRAGRRRLDVPADRTVVVEVALPERDVVVRKEVATPPAGLSKTVIFDLGRLPTPMSLTFEVVSMPAGTPLTASVAAFRERNGVQPRLLGRGRADERGRIALPWEGEGSRYEAHASGHAAWSSAIPERPEGDGVIRVELVETARLFGTLTPHRSRRQSRMLQRFVRLDGVSFRRYDDQWNQKAVVEATGEWTLSGLQLGSATDLREAARVVTDFRGTTRIVAMGLTIRPGDDIEVADVFEGAPGFRLEVLQRANVPWTNRLNLAFVPNGTPDYEPWLNTFVEASGVVEIDRLPEGRWDVYAGTMESRQLLEPLATIDHDGHTDHTITLTGFVPVQGKVVQADGTPARYALLSLHVGTERRRRSTGRRGTFTFPIVEEGTACTIEVFEATDGLHVEGYTEDEDAPTLIRARAGRPSDRTPDARVDFIANGDPITIQL
ncbi:MAG: hypothetical protein AAF957_07700 [Planctomycetota bacterium]